MSEEMELRNKHQKLYESWTEQNNKLIAFKKVIRDMIIEGSMCIAEGEFLKGQKKGELMMLEKIQEVMDKHFPVSVVRKGK